MKAGVLNRRVIFARPVRVTLADGGSEDGWLDAWECWASIRYLRGGETVLAARLSGVQPAVVTIRAGREADAIATGWRMRQVDIDGAWNIRAIVPTDDRSGLELTCDLGVAT